MLKRFNKEDFSEILADNKKKLSEKQDEYDVQQRSTEKSLTKQRNLNETLVKMNSEFKTCSVEEQD